MKYKLKNNENSSRWNLDLETIPKNLVLEQFLKHIAVSRYPRLLKGIIEHKSYSEEFTAVGFYYDYDWEHKAVLENRGLIIKEGDVRVWHEVFGDSVMTEGHFTHLIYDYSQKLLEVYHDGSEATRERLPEGWREDMTEKVALVKKLIDEKFSDKEYWLQTAVYAWVENLRLDVYEKGKKREVKNCSLLLGYKYEEGEGFYLKVFPQTDNRKSKWFKEVKFTEFCIKCSLNVFGDHMRNEYLQKIANKYHERFSLDIEIEEGEEIEAFILQKGKRIARIWGKTLLESWIEFAESREVIINTEEFFYVVEPLRKLLLDRGRGESM